MAGFCLDTGPILDFAVLRYFADVGARALEDVEVPQAVASLIRGVVGPIERRAFANMLRRGRPISTIEGVLVELAYHVERTSLNNRVFWKVVQGSYQQWSIDECPAPFARHDPGALADFGPVDEALLQHCVATSATLVSIDRPIRSRADQLGVTVLHPSELAPLFAF